MFLVGLIVLGKGFLKKIKEDQMIEDEHDKLINEKIASIITPKKIEAWN